MCEFVHFANNPWPTRDSFVYGRAISFLSIGLVRWFWKPAILICILLEPRLSLVIPTLHQYLRYTTDVFLEQAVSSKWQQRGTFFFVWENMWMKDELWNLVSCFKAQYSCDISNFAKAEILSLTVSNLRLYLSEVASAALHILYRDNPFFLGSALLWWSSDSVP